MSETALHRLANRVGLSRDWIDANARPQRVSDEVLRTVLEGLGHAAADDDASPSACARWKPPKTAITCRPC